MSMTELLPDLVSYLLWCVGGFAVCSLWSLVSFSYLDEYNTMSKSPMSLVMFKFAIEHISRVSRVLKQDNGHALLAGMICTIFKI